MTATTRTTNRLLATLALALLIPASLGAQQHRHNAQDSVSARQGHTPGMMDMRGTMSMMAGCMGMDMTSSMPGGNMAMDMCGGSLAQRVMSLQPSRILAHADALVLTSDQTSQLEQLEAEQAAAHQEHMRSMTDEIQNLSELFDSDDVEIEEIRALAERTMRPFRALQWRAITDARVVRDLLTPAQREKAGSLPLHGPMMMHQQRGNSMPHEEHEHNLPVGTLL